jgi:hypothetical protein
MNHRRTPHSDKALITTYEAPLSLTCLVQHLYERRRRVGSIANARALLVGVDWPDQKWTTILFLSFISMCSANAYCIYRAHHPDGLTHNEFQIELFTFLWNNEYWNVGQSIGRPVMLATKHELTRLPQGTRGQSGVNRHRGVCKGCVGDSTTSWSCNVCKVFLHPECMKAFHAKELLGCRRTGD